MRSTAALPDTSRSHPLRRRLTTLLLLFATAATLVVVTATAPAGAAVPTVAPTLVGPMNTTESANPVLQWEPLAGVTKYRVQVSSSSQFSSTIWSADAFNTSATPPVDLPLGTLHWRVAGMDGNSVGPYASAQFTRSQAPGPQLLAPANFATLDYPGDPVTLRWEPVPGVKNYRVEVDDATDFIGAQVIVTDSSNWALLNTQAIGQTFYWRVQGQGTVSGVNTEFSQTWRYTLAWASDGTPSVPTLLEPEAGATVTDVAFRWSPVTGAARYQIQVSPNGDWANNVTVDQIVKGTSFSPPVTLNNQDFFWRVRALSVRNPADAGPWSPDGRQFTRAWTEVPVLRSPANGAVGTDPYLLQWDPVPWASAYELQVGTDPNFSPNTWSNCFTTHTDWAPYWRVNTDPPLPPRPGTCELSDVVNDRLDFLRHGVRYYWRVRGVDQSQPNTTPTVQGRFSDVRNFMYGASPVTYGPSNGSTVSVPTLAWSKVPGAEKYEVDVYINGARERRTITWATSYTPSIEPDPDEPPPTIWWTVRALYTGAPGGNSPRGSGPVAPGGQFTLTLAEAGAPGAPVLASPAAGASLYNPEFDWSPVAGAKYYELRLFPAGSNVYETLVDHVQGGSLLRHPFRSAGTPTRPIAPGAYDWQVAAIGDAGLLSTSPRRALTVTPLAVATPTAPANCAQGATCAVQRSTPLLQWNPVEGAGYYRVHIALDPEFTNVKWVYTATQPALRPTEAFPDNQAGSSYYWFVQPCRSDGTCGRFDTGVFGTARAFRKASRPITLTSPADGARVADLTTFRWQAPSAQWVTSDANDDTEARHYRIQVSTRPDFAEILDTAEVDQTTYTPYLKTYPEGPLYWRVQARDASGNYLTMSTSRVVHKSSPMLEVTSPTNGDQANGLPVIRWDAQAFAAGYEVEYYRNGDIAWTSTNKVQTTLTQLAADTMVKSLPVGTYAYRVRRLDVDNRPGPWSSDPPPPSTDPATGDRRTFVVVGGEPSPTAPANGTVFSRPRVRLEWEPVASAVKYRVETSATAGFASLIENQETVMSAWSLVKSYPNGTIWWRVRALDAQNNVIGTSATRSFTHDLSRPTAAITKVTAGASSATVTWTATPVAAVGPFTKFEITPYIGNVAQTPVTVAGGLRTSVVPGLINGTEYSFTVTPFDANGAGTASSRSGRVRPQKVAPFTSIDRFIDRQFQDLYNRRPTTPELNDWRTRLGGSTTPAGMINSLWTSGPHASIMPPVSRLYAAIYLRTPDYGGLMYWADQRRRGVTMNDMATTFARTPEFRNMYGTLGNPAFVDLVYKNVLGRLPSTTDRNYWTAELNSGRKSRGAVMIGFSESLENRNKTQHEINASLIVLEMLRRTPSFKGTAEATSFDRSLLALLKGGFTLQQAFTLTMSTAPYAARAT